MRPASISPYALVQVHSARAGAHRSCAWISMRTANWHAAPNFAGNRCPGRLPAGRPVEVMARALPCRVVLRAGISKKMLAADSYGWHDVFHHPVMDWISPWHPLAVKQGVIGRDDDIRGAMANVGPPPHRAIVDEHAKNSQENHPAGNKGDGVMCPFGSLKDRVPPPHSRRAGNRCTACCKCRSTPPLNQASRTARPAGWKTGFR